MGGKSMLQKSVYHSLLGNQQIMMWKCCTLKCKKKKPQGRTLKTNLYGFITMTIIKCLPLM